MSFCNIHLRCNSSRSSLHQITNACFPFSLKHNSLEYQVPRLSHFQSFWNIFRHNVLKPNFHLPKHSHVKLPRISFFPNYPKFSRTLYISQHCTPHKKFEVQPLKPTRLSLPLSLYHPYLHSITSKTTCQ